MDLKKEEPASFELKSFYGKRKNRNQLDIEKKLSRIVKKHKIEKLPVDFKSSITGPSKVWKVFYKQKDAFDFLHADAPDAHVFSFESDLLGANNKGQRQFLVTTYEEFWHYYDQLDSSQKHHYEIIPQGSACKLYFDLEFSKSQNPNSNGQLMMNTFRKFVSLSLRVIFDVQCDNSHILDLDASTGIKFSRHLIYLIPGVVFKDNSHMGQFVIYIFMNWMQRYRQCSENILVKTEVLESSEQMQPVENIAQNSHRLSDEVIVNESADLISGENMNGLSSLPDYNRVEQDKTHITDTCQTSSQSHSTNNCSGVQISKLDQTNAESNGCTNSRNSESEFLELVQQFEGKNSCSNSRSCEERVPLTLSCTDKLNANESGTTEDILRPRNSANGLKDNILDEVFQEFSAEELKCLIVKNKDKQDVLFCDLGVYTRNRNFRLLSSSKLGKVNPLVVFDDNSYRRPPFTKLNKDVRTLSTSTDHLTHPQKQLFLDSLICNVQVNESMKILTFDKGGGGEELGSFVKMHSRRTKDIECSSSTIDGDRSSPYPEIDIFIRQLMVEKVSSAIIRHWTYFTDGELLIYETSGYRWCENIHRQHRSNNIMFVVDLKKGVYYQKCHDPDCRIQNFKSQEYRVPSNLLPSFYFQNDDFDDEMQVKPQSSVDSKNDSHPSVNGNKSLFLSSSSQKLFDRFESDEDELDDVSLVQAAQICEASL